MAMSVFLLCLATRKVLCGHSWSLQVRKSSLLRVGAKPTDHMNPAAEPSPEFQRLLEFTKDAKLPSGTEFQESWPLGEERETKLLMCYADEKSGLLPTQGSIIDVEPMSIVDEIIRQNKALVIPIGWTFSGVKEIRIVPVVSLATVLRMEPSKGGVRLHLQVTGRCQIVSCNGEKARLVPKVDDRLDNAVNNVGAESPEHSILHSLDRRCFDKAVLLSTLKGQTQTVAELKRIPSLAKRLEAHLALFSALPRYQLDEVFSFAALAPHIDMEGRLWANDTVETPRRMETAERVLKEKVDRLQSEVTAEQQSLGARGIKGAGSLFENSR